MKFFKHAGKHDDDAFACVRVLAEEALKILGENLDERSPRFPVSNEATNLLFPDLESLSGVVFGEEFIEVFREAAGVLRSHSHRFQEELDSLRKRVDAVR